VKTSASGQKQPKIAIAEFSDKPPLGLRQIVRR